MKKIFSFLIFSIIVSYLLFLSPSRVFSAGTCPIPPFSYTPLYDTSSTVTFTMGPVQIGEKYIIEADCDGLWNAISTVVATENIISHTFDRNVGNAKCIFKIGTHNVSLHFREIKDPPTPLCTSTFTVTSACEIKVNPTYPETNIPFTISGGNVPGNANYLKIFGPSSINLTIPVSVKNNSFSAGNITLPSTGTYRAVVVYAPPGASDDIPVGCPEKPFTVILPGAPTPGGTWPGGTGGGIKPTPCDVKTGTADPNGDGIFTALGCIPIKDPTRFVAWLLGFAIGIGGGIAILLIIFGAFQVMTSSGNPENLKKGNEMITSAIGGLIFIIFSVFLLKLIGVDILKLPGFGK